MTRYSYICQRTSLDELLMQGAVMCCSTTSPPSTLTTVTEVRAHLCPRMHILLSNVQTACVCTQAHAAGTCQWHAPCECRLCVALLWAGMIFRIRIPGGAAGQCNNGTAGFTGTLQTGQDTCRLLGRDGLMCCWMLIQTMRYTCQQP